MIHTPEPWRAEWQPGQTPNHTYTHCVMCGDDSLCDTLTKADAYRIVACVNACTGMADPAKEIAEMREKIAALEAQLAEALKYGARDNAEALSCVKHLLCKKHNQYWTTISGACMACRAVDAESQLAAANEAVRVLGKEVVDCMDMGQLTVRHLNPETIDNPIASAAITDAAKAREGA